ncbi:MAG: TonB-dependent receptor [Alphaproteobacteria bacterium]|nr:TonB-dependent receptor [Alphaproteobacteria bacterium]
MPTTYRAATALLAGAAFVSLMQPVHAQETAAGKPAPEDTGDTITAPAEKAEGEGIVVTGSRIRGAGFTGDVTTLDREAIIAAGQIDLGEAIRSLPQNFSGGQNPGIGTGAGLANANVNSASSANLRGLGPDATLTLLNGHRLPYDSAFQGVDISAIPLAALDRIEVVPDGASAVYGSDAVAGVVNVILRRDFEGVATSGQLGASSGGGYFRQQADLVAGKKWSGGGFLLAYDFVHNSAIDADQRSYAGSLDPDSSLFPSQSRHAVTLSARQELGAGVTASLDALYSNRHSQTIGGTPALRSEFRPAVESYTLAPSLEVALGSGWQASLSGVYGRDRTHVSTRFTPQTGAGRLITGCICNSVTSLEFGAEGALFALPGGSARLALGGGFRNNGMDFTQPVNGVPGREFDVTRRSRFAYGEVYLPFVSPGMELPGLRQLSLSGALRYEDIRSMDKVATPRLGLIYSPFSPLILRGTWSRSFKAPTLFQQFIPFQAFLLPAAAFGAGPGTVMFASGGNPDLVPERARSWTAGFELRPKSVQDLTIAATWFDINYRDRVVQPIAGSIAAAFRDPGFATLINFSPSPAELDDLIAGALFGLENFSGSAFDPANVAALVDNRNINVALQDIHGIDGRLAWSNDLGEGRRLGFDLAGTWLKSSQQLTADLPEVQLAGTVFNPPKLRLRGTASFASGGFRLSSSLNMTGRLTDRRFATESRISPNATLDMSASYDVIPGEGRDPGLTIALTVNNLLGDRPEVIRTTGPTDTPFDSTNFSPIGRFIALGIRRQW